jgi:hypothetical protein
MVQMTSVLQDIVLFESSKLFPLTFPTREIAKNDPTVQLSSLINGYDIIVILHFTSFDDLLLDYSIS